jgi:hypothetical protein
LNAWFPAAASLSLFWTGLWMGSAQAGTITYITPSGATAVGGPVDAAAVFVTSTDTLTVTLLNLLSNPKDVAQNLSDLGFAISSGQTTGTLTDSSGQELSVYSNGTFTFGSTVPTGWQLDSDGAPFHLDLLGTPTRAHTIIGGPGAGGTYSNANGSIARNNAHNPFLNGEATFTLNIPGLTDASSISSASFSFGTTEGADVFPGIIQSVPEPASIGILAFGMVGLAGCSLPRRFVRVRTQRALLPGFRFCGLLSGVRTWLRIRKRRQARS